MEAKRRLTCLYCERWWAHMDRVLVTQTKALPAAILPPHLSALDYWREGDGASALGTPLLVGKQIGSVGGEDYEMYVVSGDVDPAQVLEYNQFATPVLWFCKGEAVRSRVLQTLIIALCSAGITGWHIDTTSGEIAAEVSYTMRDGKAIQDHPDPPSPHAPRLGPIAEEMRKEEEVQNVDKPSN